MGFRFIVRLYREDSSSLCRRKTVYLLLVLDKLRRVKGDRYPELIEVHELFKQSAEDLRAQHEKEELVLFPFIRNMVEAKEEGVELPKPHFKCSRKSN